MYILKPPAAGILCAPSFVRPPTPRRVSFFRGGGGGCIRFGPVAYPSLRCTKTTDVLTKSEAATILRARCKAQVGRLEGDLLLDVAGPLRWEWSVAPPVFECLLSFMEMSRRQRLVTDLPDTQDG